MAPALAWLAWMRKLNPLGKAVHPRKDKLVEIQVVVVVALKVRVIVMEVLLKVVLTVEVVFVSEVDTMGNVGMMLV